MMSRRQTRYMPPSVHPVSMSIPRAYYLQEDADFSEGDMEPLFGWPEGSRPQNCPGGEMHDNMMGCNNADVTELYRRKNEEYLLSPEVVMSEDPRYYYRPAALSRLPQRRLPIALTPSSHGMPMHPGQYYPPPPLEEPHIHYENVMYRSQPQLPRMIDRPSPGSVIRRPLQHIAESSPQVNNLVRSVRTPSKAPVTVRTPRYYRRTNLYKRPSALCLQLPSSPDPSARPIKPRFTSTIPGLSIPPMVLRHHGQTSYSRHAAPASEVTQHTTHHHADRPRTSARSHMMDERVNEREREIERRVLTSRSAPPRCPDDRMKLDEDGVPAIAEYGDESVSQQGDPDHKCSELELLLNQYEQIFSGEQETQANMNRHQTSSRKLSSKTKPKRKPSMNKFMSMMKPRLPPSLKALQKRNSSKASIKPAQHFASSDRLEIEQMTAEVLDTLLHDLSTGGFVDNIKPNENTNKTDQNQHNSRTGSKIAIKPEIENRNVPNSEQKDTREERDNQRIDKKDGSDSKREHRMDSARRKESPRSDEDKKSSKHSPVKKSDFYSDSKHFPSEPFDDIPTKTTFMQDTDKFSKFNSSHTFFENNQSRNRRSRSRSSSVYQGERDESSGIKIDDHKNQVKKPCAKKGFKTEEHSALELHKSKSYIVNLIDRALSRELGTIPEERSSKQFLNLDPRTAMDLIANKNIDNEMCLELTQALADSFINEESSTSKTASPPCCSKPAECSRGENNGPENELLFTSGNDEPLYIKQLKKLRWGHLKHIQREMRRLEDLERFLDSCGSEK